MTLETELRAACAATRGLFGAAACSCALATEDGSGLEFVAADGAGADAIVGVRLPISRGIAGFVALSGQPMSIADVTRDERFARDVAESTDYVPTSILAVPLLDEDGETIGVLEVLDPVRPDDESRLGAQRGSVAELAALTVVATQVASVVRLTRKLDASAGTVTDPELLVALAEVTSRGGQGARLARDVLHALAAYTRTQP